MNDSSVHPRAVVHLGDKTSIASLAALLDLSRLHFIRAFKKPLACRHTGSWSTGGSSAHEKCCKIRK